MEEVLEEKNVPTKSKKDAFMEYILFYKKDKNSPLEIIF